MDIIVEIVDETKRMENIHFARILIRTTMHNLDMVKQIKINDDICRIWSMEEIHVVNYMNTGAYKLRYTDDKSYMVSKWKEREVDSLMSNNKEEVRWWPKEISNFLATIEGETQNRCMTNYIFRATTTASPASQIRMIHNLRVLEMIQMRYLQLRLPHTQSWVAGFN